MILAEALPIDVIGYIVLGLFTLVTGVNSIKSLFEKRADKEAVTRKEFDDMKVNMKADYITIAAQTAKLTEYVSRTELLTMRNDLTQQIEKLDKYSRGRNHKFADKLNELQLTVEAMPHTIHAELTKQLEKITMKLERNNDSIVELRAMLNKRNQLTDEGKS